MILKTHLLKHGTGRAQTMCGRQVSDRIVLIGPNELVDNATCVSCQRADDAQQVRSYAEDCKRAGKAYGEL